MRTPPVLLVTALLVALLVSMVLWQTPWGALPGGLPVAPADQEFTAQEIAGAHEFRSTMRLLAVFSLGLGVLVLTLIAITGARWIERLPGGPARQTAVAVAMISLVLFLVRLPIAVISERIARREGLSTSTWASWSQDQAKSLAITIAVGSLALVLLGVLARSQPRLWWATAATGAAALAVALSFLLPVVFEPIFNRFSPMGEGRLRTTLMELAARDGVPVREVLVADASRRTTALNAYVSGFGATRRIVVYDTLLESAPESEVEMVVAHELGHAKERDVLVGTLIGALGAAIAVLMLALLMGARVADPSSVAAILAWLALFSVIQQPMANAISRQIEARADQHALTLTRDPQTFAEMQRRLATTNRADVIAPRWAYLLFASHPSTRERIALARWWADRNDLPIPGPLAPQ